MYVCIYIYIYIYVIYMIIIIIMIVITVLIITVVIIIIIITVIMIIIVVMEVLGAKEHWLIQRRQLTVHHHSILGRGSFGLVVQGSYCGSPVAVKLYSHRGALSQTDRGTLDQTVFNECRVLRHVRHPNIVLFHGAVIDPSKHDIQIVLEKVEGETLEAFAACSPDPADPGLGAAEKICVGKGICRALVYLHAQVPSIVHGDMKPNNIMVETYNMRPRAKLLDFGISCVVTRTAKAKRGSLAYTDPELASNLLPRPSSDVFSLGLLLFYIATGRKHSRIITIIIAIHITTINYYY